MSSDSQPDLAKSPSALKRLMRMVKRLAIVITILLALLVLVLSFSGPFLERHKDGVSSYLSHALHAEVHINSLHFSWYALQPLIRLDGVRISSKERRLLALKRCYIGLNIWRSVWEWHWQPGLIILDGAVINLKHHQWLERLVDQQNTKVNDPIDVDYEDIIQWFFHQKEVRFKGVAVLLPGQQQPLNIQRFRIYNHADNHRIELFAQQSNTSTKGMVIKLLGKLSGDSLQSLSGKYYLFVDNFSVSLFNPVLHPLFAANSGTMKASLWGQWNQGRTHNQVSFLMKHLNLQNLHNKHVHRLRYTQSHAIIDTKPHQWTVMTRDLKFRSSDSKTAAYKVLLKRDAKRQVIQLNSFNLASVQSWFKFLGIQLPGQWQKMTLSGRVRNFQLQYQGKKILSIMANLEDVSAYQANGTLLSHLSGDIYYGDQQGHLVLNGHDTEVSFPRPYRQTFKVNHLTGDIYCKKLDGVWRVLSDNLTLTNEYVRAVEQFSLELHHPWTQSIISADSHVVVKHLEALKTYLPKQRLNPRLYTWLSQAIIRVPKVTVRTVIKGRLSDFPFDKPGGYFNLDATVSDTTLRYHPEWPVATHIYARIAVSGRDFVADIKRGQMGAVAIHDIRISIPNIGGPDQRLMLTTKQSLPVQAAIDYIMRSRLHNRLAMLKRLRFDGVGTLDLQLQLGLTPEDNEETFIGVIDLTDNKVWFEAYPKLSIQRANGKLLFGQQGVEYSLFDGEFVGGKTELAIKTKEKNILFNGKGTLVTQELIASLPTAIQWTKNFVKGDLTYHWMADIPPDASPVKFKLNSNFKHTALSLPLPFQKSANTSWPMQARLSTDSHDLLLDIDIKHLLRTKLAFKREPQFTLDRGTISFARHSEAKLPSDNKILVEGKVPYLSLDHWAIFLEQVSKENEHPKSIVLPEVNIEAKQLVALFCEYQNVHFKLSGNSLDFAMQFTGADILGAMHYLKKEDSTPDLMMNFNRLHYVSDAIHLPSNFNRGKVGPNVKANVTHFSWDKYALGSLQVTARSFKSGYQITTASLLNPAMTIKLNGEISHQQPYLTLAGYLQTDNIAKLFQQFHLEPVLEGKYGLVNFRVIDKKPLRYANLLTDLNASMRFDLRRGRITHLNKQTESKIGLGKLLSILSLQTLPRRMVLDFSDLSQKGFSFDKFNGDLTLEHGLLKTNNTRVNGPVAFVQLWGALNLLLHRYDVTLKVVPHVTASLPVVATIAGGPVAGVATWLVGKILMQGMSKISAYTYHIDGPWDAPVVQQIGLTRVPKTK